MTAAAGSLLSMGMMKNLRSLTKNLAGSIILLLGYFQAVITISLYVSSQSNHPDQVFSSRTVVGEDVAAAGLVGKKAHEIARILVVEQHLGVAFEKFGHLDGEGTAIRVEGEPITL